jgi:hypothetical protein
VLTLGCYNHARFGSFTEFGTNYQLTGRRYEPNFGLVLPNLHAYLLRPFTLSCEFPFLVAPIHAQALTPAWVPRSSGYSPKEPTVGLLFGVPFVLFGGAAVWAAALSLARWHRNGLRGQADLSLIWLVGCCGSIALLAGLPDLGVWFSTMRYLTDVTPAFLVLALAGFWVLVERSPPPRPRYLLGGVHVAGATLATYTIAVGVLLGFQGGYSASIKRLNRPLHTQLVTTLSLCERTPRAPDDRAR